MNAVNDVPPEPSAKAVPVKKEVCMGRHQGFSLGDSFRPNGTLVTC